MAELKRGKGDFSAAMTKEELNIIFLLDTSGSMTGERINQLNIAMPEALEALKDAAMRQEMKVIVRVAEFNNFASWIMGKTEEGVAVEEAEGLWKDLAAKPAGTNTADALRLASAVMHTKYLGDRNYKPYVILITDGESNNYQETQAAVDQLKKSLVSASDPNKNKIERIAIGVVEANERELEYFASTGTIVREDGSTQENVPLVFKIDDVSRLGELLKGIAVSSIASATGTGDDAGPVIETAPADDGDWED